MLRAGMQLSSGAAQNGPYGACIGPCVRTMTSMSSRMRVAQFRLPLAQEAARNGRNPINRVPFPRMGSRVSRAPLRVPGELRPCRLVRPRLIHGALPAHRHLERAACADRKNEAPALSSQADLAGIGLPGGWCFRIAREPARESVFRLPVCGRFHPPELACPLPSRDARLPGGPSFLV